MAEKMYHPFKNYNLAQSEEIISSEFKEELEAFNEKLFIIAKGVAEKFMDETVLENVTSSRSPLILREDVAKIKDLRFISFDGAINQIAAAMIVGFNFAVEEFMAINPDVKPEVKVQPTKDQPSRADFVLFVPKEGEES